MFLHKNSNVGKDKVYHSYLIQESYREKGREKGKVKHKTIANLSSLPMDFIEKRRKIYNR